MRRPIAEFCGVTESAVARWFRDEKPPIGEGAIRLTCYLDLIGYAIIGFERMGQGRKVCMELIGYGLMSTQEMSDHLEYVTNRSIFRILQGENKPGRDKEAKMWELGKARKEELKEAKAKARKKYCRGPEQPAVLVRNESLSKARTKSGNGQGAAFHLMISLSFLLKDGVFDNLSEDEIDKLQKRGVSSTILKLSGQLSVISSKLVVPRG